MINPNPPYLAQEALHGLFRFPSANLGVSHYLELSQPPNLCWLQHRLLGPPVLVQVTIVLPKAISNLSCLPVPPKYLSGKDLQPQSL